MAAAAGRPGACRYGSIQVNSDGSATVPEGRTCGTTKDENCGQPWASLITFRSTAATNHEQVLWAAGFRIKLALTPTGALEFRYGEDLINQNGVT